jgi:hypothetical protein
LIKKNILQDNPFSSYRISKLLIFYLTFSSNPCGIIKTANSVKQNPDPSCQLVSYEEGEGYGGVKVAGCQSPVIGTWRLSTNNPS